MNWKIILLVSLFGLVMGIASLFGLTQGIEIWLWLIIAIASGFIFSVTVERKIFVHAVVAGLFMGILNSVIQSLFFDMYLLNNPASLDGIRNLPAAISPNIFVLIVGPFIGLVYGLFIGLMAVITDKMRGKK